MLLASDFQMVFISPSWLIQTHTRLFLPSTQTSGSKHWDALIMAFISVYQFRFKPANSVSTTVTLFQFLKDFLMWTIFKVFTEFVTIFLLIFIFWYFGLEAYGISAPQPGIEATHAALEGSLNHWTTGVHSHYYFQQF